MKDKRDETEEAGGASGGGDDSGIVSGRGHVVLPDPDDTELGALTPELTRDGATEDRSSTDDQPIEVEADPADVPEAPPEEEEKRTETVSPLTRITIRLDMMEGRKTEPRIIDVTPQPQLEEQTDAEDS